MRNRFVTVPVFALRLLAVCIMLGVVGLGHPAQAEGRETTAPLTLQIDNVNIVGPEHGVIGEKYEFTAEIEPKDVIPSPAYLWTPSPESGQGTEEATYSFDTVGKQEIKITVTADNGAIVEDSQIINIAPAPFIPVTEAALSTAQSTVNVDTLTAITLIITPPSASGYTIVWDPFPDDGQGKSEATYTWSQAGDETVSVEIINADSSRVSADIGITVVDDDPGITRGDVNCDGQINARDATIILRYRAGYMTATNTCALQTGEMYEPACDVNQDESCNARDATIILRCRAGYPNEFCP